MTGHDEPRDWRGAPIRPGALVVYGAPVGRSIAMVEGRISDPMYTPSGRIWVDVVRRAYGGGYAEGAERVHVGADRLTIVDQLPAATTATDEQLRAEARTVIADRARRYETHRIVNHDSRWDNRYCGACGITGASTLSDTACAGAP